MESIALSGWDFAIIAAFVAYAVTSGFRQKKVASQNLEEYFLAGRSLPGWKAGLSMAATQFAADTPLMVTGMIATAGIFSLWRLWIYALAFLLMGFLLAASWRRAGVLTDAELTEIRYGNKAAAALRGVNRHTAPVDAADVTRCHHGPLLGNGCVDGAGAYGLEQLPALALVEGRQPPGVRRADLGRDAEGRRGKGLHR